MGDKQCAVPEGQATAGRADGENGRDSCFLVALWLDEVVQDLAFAIDCAPEVHPLSTNLDKHFVEVPPIIGSCSEVSEMVRIFSSELEHPPPDRFIRYVETSPGQQVFHVSEAQREPAIKPNGVLDDFSREAVAPIRDLFHRWRLNVPQHRWKAINVPMPFRRVATRYEILGANFLATTKLAAIRVWLRAIESTA